MKKSDAQLIISAVGRAVRKLLDPLRLNVVELTERLSASSEVVAQQRALIDEQRKQIDVLAANVTQLSERQAAHENSIAATDTKSIPTAKEIAAEYVELMKGLIVAPPTADEVAQIVLRQIPTADSIVEQVRAELPDVSEIAAHVQIPAMPTAEEIAERCKDAVAKQCAEALPVEEIVKRAAESMPTAEAVAQLIKIDPPPSVDEIAQRCVESFPVDTVVGRVREALPTDEEIVRRVRDTMPSAEEIAKHVPVPAVELQEIPSVDDLVARAIEQVKEILPGMIPAPVKGDPGDSVSIDDVRSVISDELKSVPQQLAELTKVAIQTHVTPEFAQLETSIEAKSEKSFAQWQLQFERQAQAVLQRAIENMPKPKDGVDGFGFDDMDVSFNAETKELSLTFAREGREPKVFKFFVPVPVHRGVYGHEKKYLEADCVTRDGCTWMAMKTDPTGEPTDHRSEDWRLIVKRGRDGRDLREEKDAQPTRVRVAPRKKGDK